MSSAATSSFEKKKYILNTVTNKVLWVILITKKANVLSNFKVYFKPFNSLWFLLMDSAFDVTQNIWL